MWTEDFSLEILRIIFKKKLWFRTVALDLETKVLREDAFLTNERLLGFSLARRKSDNTIETANLILEEDSDTSELVLLNKLNDYLKKWKPLLIVGYGCRDYDLPLLAVKKQRAKLLNHSLWSISNILSGSIHIELADLSRYIFDKKYHEGRKYRSMLEVMNHKHFEDLPFIRSKTAVAPSKERKGQEIYELWKTKDPKFLRYLEGEAHDQLLIAERIRDTDI